MLQALYFVAMLVGVAWLCAWAILPAGLRARFPSPFDMRDGDGGEELTGSPVVLRDGGWRARAAAPRPTAHLQHALPERRVPQSWRVRREPAPSPRRVR